MRTNELQVYSSSDSSPQNKLWCNKNLWKSLLLYHSLYDLHQELISTWGNFKFFHIWPMFDITTWNIEKLHDYLSQKAYVCFVYFPGWLLTSLASWKAQETKRSFMLVWLGFLLRHAVVQQEDIENKILFLLRERLHFSCAVAFENKIWFWSGNSLIWSNNAVFKNKILTFVREIFYFSFQAF